MLIPMALVDEVVDAVRQLMRQPGRRLRVYEYDEDGVYLLSQRYYLQLPNLSRSEWAVLDRRLQALGTPIIYGPGRTVYVESEVHEMGLFDLLYYLSHHGLGISGSDKLARLLGGLGSNAFGVVRYHIIAYVVYRGRYVTVRNMFTVRRLD